MRKWFRRIHLWLAIPSGVIIFVICITGAIMVFQNEILELSNRERYYVAQVGEQALPLDSLIESVNQKLCQDTIKSVQIFSDKHRTIEAALSSAPRSYVYIDPYTAQITGYHNVRSGFFHGVLRLHRWMMMSNIENGRVITGVSTLFFIVVLISGVFVWSPHRIRQLKSSVKIKFKSNFVRKLFDFHRVCGVYAVIVLFLMALTGLMWSFGWYRDAAAKVFNIENSTKERGEKLDGKKSEKQEKGGALWQDVYDAVQREELNYKSVKIEHRGVVTLLPSDAITPRATDAYKYNRLNKSLVLTSRHGDKRDRGYMMGWAYVLHVGSWGGVFTKILAFIASLIGASLPITGYMLFYRKVKRKHHRQRLKEVSDLEILLSGKKH